MKLPSIRIGGVGITLSTQFFLWPILLIAALFLAQSLKMAVSHMVFVFVLQMPIGAILQLILARQFLRISVRTDTDTVEKRDPIAFSAIVSNDCILPFPFVEAELMLPDEKGIGCAPRSFVLTLAPMSACTVERTLRFTFRGEYRVGIRAIRVCDCFRTIELRIPCDCFREIFVLPRRFELPPRPHTAESELDTQRVMRARGTDNTELSDIRAYENGDSLKSIHWKLSSKSEELIVKDYSRNKGSSVRILCDLEPHFRNLGDRQPPRMPRPEYADIIDMLSTDLVVETCIASVLRELRAGNDVTLLWSADGISTSAELRSTADFEAAYRRIATAPLDPAEHQLRTLAAAGQTSESASLILVTAYLDEASVLEYTNLALLYSGGGTKPPELLWCADESLFTDSESDAKHQRDCIFELERAGISVIPVHREPWAAGPGA